MAKLYQQTLWWRFGSIFFLGFFVKLLLDLIFKLIYRYYSIEWSQYMGAVILAFIVVEGIRFINRRLDERLSWYINPQKRFLIQTLTNIAYVLFVVNVVHTLLFHQVLFPKAFIRLSDEIISNAVVVFVTLVSVVIDLGVYLLNKWRMSLAELERFKKREYRISF